MCTSWEEEVDGSLQYGKTIKACQYDGVIIDALISIRHRYKAVVKADYQRRLRDAGIKEGDFKGELK